MRGISKEFPGVKALDNVTLKVKRGSVHALMGENGAGKSTLMKCLFGIYSADKGEIFVLDMGKPVKIDDLARSLIKLYGYEPDKDIKIVYTGLRPGEKLYEELLMSEEGLKATENSLIHIGKPIEIDEEFFFGTLHNMRKCMADDTADIRGLVKEIVPTYVYKEK